MTGQGSKWRAILGSPERQGDPGDGQGCLRGAQPVGVLEVNRQRSRSPNVSGAAARPAARRRSGSAAPRAPRARRRRPGATGSRPRGCKARDQRVSPRGGGPALPGAGEGGRAAVARALASPRRDRVQRHHPRRGGTPGAIPVDTHRHPLAADPRIFSYGRIHANTRGHAIAAAAVATTLAQVALSS
jgi:hypothetical protein